VLFEFLSGEHPVKCWVNNAPTLFQIARNLLLENGGVDVVHDGGVTIETFLDITPITVMFATFGPPVTPLIFNKMQALVVAALGSITWVELMGQAVLITNRSL
jgi:hypothetical protein